MSAPIPELEKLIDFLKRNQVHIDFFQSYPDVPRGWKLENMGFSDADIIEEDRLTYCGFFKVEDYKNELMVKIGQAIAGLKNKLSRYGDYGRKEYMSELLKRIDIIGLNKQEENINLEITYTCKSPVRQSIFDANLADPIELICEYSQNQLKEFLSIKMSLSEELVQSITEIESPPVETDSQSDSEESINPGNIIKPADRFFTTKELAEYLRVSERSIASYRADGKLSFTKIGRKIVYTQKDVEEFTDKYKIKRYK